MQKTFYYKNFDFRTDLALHYYKEFNKSKVILDVGCGTGEFGKSKPSDSIRVYGVDCDDNALRAASEYEFVEKIDLDCNSLPFEDNFFDAVLAKDILEHVQKPWLLLKEIHRIIKDNGIIIASVPMPKPNIVWSDYTHLRGFTKDCLETLFKDSQFEVLYIKKIGDIPLFRRFGLTEYVPDVLEIPPMNYFFGITFEIKAKKLRNIIG
jgi:ubiquinone/menaquinone biosynthesis C-methylase UbiE